MYLTEKQVMALATISRGLAEAFVQIADARRKFLRAGVAALGPEVERDG